MGSHRQRLALECERLDFLEACLVAHEHRRQAANEDLTGRGGLFETRGHVHGIPCHQPLAEAHLPADHLPRVDADGDREADRGIARQLSGQGRKGCANLQGGADCTQRVVLVADGQAEDGHDRVADVLLDGAAVPGESVT